MSVCVAPRRRYSKSTVYIERGDFREVDDKSFFGLAPDKTVRLLFGYNITCTGVKKDTAGKVTSLEATFDADSMGTKPPKGTLHWASTEFVGGEAGSSAHPCMSAPDLRLKYLYTRGHHSGSER